MQCSGLATNGDDERARRVCTGLEQPLLGLVGELELAHGVQKVLEVVLRQPPVVVPVVHPVGELHLLVAGPLGTEDAHDAHILQEGDLARGVGVEALEQAPLDRRVPRCLELEELAGGDRARTVDVVGLELAVQPQQLALVEVGDHH